MQPFKPVSAGDAATLRSYYRACDCALCEYSLGCLLMWAPAECPEWTEAAGCLLVRTTRRGETAYRYPLPSPSGGDESAALAAIEADAIDAERPLVFDPVPSAKAPVLLQRYPYSRVSNLRTWRDYVYRLSDIRDYPGRPYAGQRNHVRRFAAACPSAATRPLTPADLPALRRFLDECRDASPPPLDAEDTAPVELELARRMLPFVGSPHFISTGIFDRDRLLAFSLAETCGPCLHVHIEKALLSCPGIGPAIARATAAAAPPGIEFLNREDDAADRGLRISKLQYHPLRLEPKYRFEPQNELLRHLPAPPSIATPRLRLDAIAEPDSPAYDALVLDREWNRWWGCDDLAALRAPYRPGAFLEVARADFARRTALNLAIRLDGRFIGETVLYRFNFRGDAELGCRILPAFSGHGYGAEAFAAVADWALYRLHLNRVLAKCYRENEASRRMLAACMRPAGSDATFLYFSKEA